MKRRPLPNYTSACAMKRLHCCRGLPSRLIDAEPLQAVAVLLDHRWLDHSGLWVHYRNAIRYTKALHELHSNVEDMILVDYVHLLANFSKTAMLQYDVFHLFQLGQDLVGEAMGQAIFADIRIKNCECFENAQRHQLGWQERYCAS
jgi:hypothetical protein